MFDSLPDPSADPDFTNQLRALRHWAGQPSLRQLRVLGGERPTPDGADRVACLPESTVSYVLRGDRPASATFVRSFVAACLRARRCDLKVIEQQVERWHEAWLAGAAGPAGPGRRPPAHRPATPQPAPPTPGPASAAVPRQLPADIRAFAGRLPEIASLDALLPDPGGSAPPPVVISAITGTAGVGKTALAIHWAHRVADRFPDGMLYVDLHGFHPDRRPMPPDEALRGFLDAVALPPPRMPATAAARAALYRSLLAGRRMLILLDNAHDAGQIRPLLPGAAGCLVLVTSRHQLTGLVAAEGAYPLTLDLLSEAESHELLRRRLGTRRLAADRAATAEIIQRCARLPLALAIVAARAAVRPDLPIRDLARELHKASPELDAWTDPDPNVDIRAAFEVSYRALSPSAARLFRLLGLHPGPQTSMPAAASLLGVPLSQLAGPLAELTRAHLVTELHPGRYGLHDLLRSYAIELALHHDSDPARQAATARMLDFYLHTARAAAVLINPYRQLGPAAPADPTVSPEALDPASAPGWLGREHRVLLTICTQAADLGFASHGYQLARAIAEFLQLGGHWDDWLRSQLAGLEAARLLADPDAEARCHRGVAGAHISLGNLDQARHHLSAALELYRKLGDQTQRAHVHHDIGVVLTEQGCHQEALHHNHEALRLSRAAADQVGQAIALNGIGWCHAQLGEYRQALEHCGQALELQERAGDRRGIPPTLDSLGYAHEHLGQHGEAVACYTRAVALARETGDRHGEATILQNLGNAHRAAGDPAAARRSWQEALAILEELHHPGAAALRAELSR